ncbi:uncharacterized protein LOC127245309 [Andrographis paniculata]|uniref:uncharacterized protein LOC127245309 n=1 Tax=Andrographis paniculata TaxID=175694 RepID=UPI0021E7B205|nr:uncharacterized protein LOC127245309 [Andrographis paniculata]
MATELEAADAQITAAAPPAQISADAAPSSDPPPLENPTPAVAPTTNPPKRQRRPSVRLGEIGGEQPHDAPPRRPGRIWRFHKDPSLAAKSSKTRPLTNLVNGGATDSNFQDTIDPSENFADFPHRKPKIRKPARRARTNWNKFDSIAVNNGGTATGPSPSEPPNFLQQQQNTNEELRELEAAENSASPLLKDQQSPINSGENMGLQFWDQHRGGSNGLHHNEEGSNVGVREWLLGLGLGRYSPVFEIHEVDDEVLPMLTLEDLKDMGITAVGSRRKMYSSIIKLRKGFGFPK